MGVERVLCGRKRRSFAAGNSNASASSKSVIAIKIAKFAQAPRIGCSNLIFGHQNRLIIYFAVRLFVRLFVCLFVCLYRTRAQYCSAFRYPANTIDTHKFQNWICALQFKLEHRNRRVEIMYVFDYFYDR